MNTTTKSAQFTPGPWVVECKKFIATPKAVVIAELNDGLQGEYPESGHINANATLIAAAPAMYEALKEWCDYYAAYNPIRDKRIEPFIQLTRKALAQAEGRQG